MIKRLAIIPARGGSKRIANKNIRTFHGRPMIHYILEAAKNSLLFDVIHVSTDSSDIKKVVEELGFLVDFMRPPELSDDITPIFPVLRFVAGHYGDLGLHFDEIWLLMACAPFVSAEDLIRASALFLEAGSRQPLLAVSEYPVPIEWGFRRKPDGRLLPIQPGMFAVRSQDLEKCYFDAGTFAVFPSSHVLRSQGSGSDADFIGCVLPKGSAIDIDEELDWQMAEAMWRARYIRTQCEVDYSRR